MLQGRGTRKPPSPVKDRGRGLGDEGNPPTSQLGSSPRQPQSAQSPPPVAWHRSAPPSRPRPSRRMPRTPQPSSYPRRFLQFHRAVLLALRASPLLTDFRLPTQSWYATSPWVVVSNPRTSSCSGTRRPTVTSTTLRMIQVAAAVNAATAATATACFSNCPGLP
jgi:hypothetical protein